MKHTIVIISFFLSSFFLFSQNITAKIIDKNTKTPIPYASVKTGKHSGVISNEEGFFTVFMENDTKTISVSCMGYQNTILSTQKIKSLNYIIELSEAINQLNEVFISNKKPNADTIITRVKKKLAVNYDSKLNKYSIFYRKTSNVDFKSLDIEIEKASRVSSKNIDEANNGLTRLSKTIKDTDIIHFTDFKADIYNFNKDSSKLIVHKATKLLDHKKEFSIDDIQEKVQSIVLKYLDTTKTYKLKTGIFKVEDSLALNNEEFKDKEEEKTKFKPANLNNETRNLFNKTQFFDTSFLSTILNSGLYEYMLEDTSYNNGDLTYIISFNPKKGKAKYTGTLFISHANYAITRTDFKYYKNRHGPKLNLKFLLGVKYIENIHEGILLFEKNTSNVYQPKYLKITEGSYFYVNRDLRFIENSNAKKKVNFNFKIEGDNRDKIELLFTANSKLNMVDFNLIKQDTIGAFKILNTFEKTIWKDDETLEPLEEMKSFGIGK
jgi:hypothetical protein